MPDPKIRVRDRIEFAKIINYQVIPLNKAPQAYQDFDAGLPKKVIIDPHNNLTSNLTLYGYNRSKS